LNGLHFSSRENVKQKREIYTYKYVEKKKFFFYECFNCAIKIKKVSFIPNNDFVKNYALSKFYNFINLLLK